MEQKIEIIQQVINYIETHLSEKMYLETIAGAVNYSKYYLHRTFSFITGMTIHEYIVRRRLTEAAKLLVFSRKPIIEVALMTGYESQQAFAAAFKCMYKRSPKQFREEKRYYSLQNRYVLNPVDSLGVGSEWKFKMKFVSEEDIPSCIDFVEKVVDGLPNLDWSQFITRLKQSIKYEQTLIMKNEKITVGLTAFDRKRGTIDFWGINPQYRKLEVEKVFLKKVLHELKDDREVSVTTFREGDKADRGYRNSFKNLGFVEREHLVEYGYPTQRFVCINQESL